MWLNILNVIEGRQSFIKTKIFLRRSAKKLIRFSLILLLFVIISTYLNGIIGSFTWGIPSFQKLSFKYFLFSIPWQILSDVWAFYVSAYNFIYLFITIICYYYQLRIHQLDVYAIWLLKQKQFKMLDQRIIRLLQEYANIITEIDQFNKFASKTIFFIYLFEGATVVFALYNVMFVNLSPPSLFGQGTPSIDMLFIMSFITLNVIRIRNQFLKNKKKFDLTNV